MIHFLESLGIKLNQLIDRVLLNKNKQPFEKVMFEAYLKDTATDYSKYQKDIDNELRIKVLNVKNINRIVI